MTKANNLVNTSQTSIPVSSRNKSKKSNQGLDVKAPSGGFGGNNAPDPAGKKVEFETILNFDLYDKNAVFVEGQDSSQPSTLTHYLTNDFEQHSLICSSPLEIPDFDEASLSQ